MAFMISTLFALCMLSFVHTEPIDTFQKHTYAGELHATHDLDVFSLMIWGPVPGC